MGHAGRPKTKQHKITPVERIYPPRKNCTRALYRARISEDGWEMYHIGYKIAKARRCVCGVEPVFERYTEDTSVPAEVFIGICPYCERRTAGEGDLRTVLHQWNAGEISDDSEMLQYSPRELNYEGVALLHRVMVKHAKKDAVYYIRAKHEKFGEKRDGNYPVFYGAELKKIEDFFRWSPLMLDISADGIMSEIRREMYPGKTHDELMQIPLKLTEM